MRNLAARFRASLLGDLDGLYRVLLIHHLSPVGWHPTSGFVSIRYRCFHPRALLSPAQLHKTTNTARNKHIKQNEKWRITKCCASSTFPVMMSESYLATRLGSSFLLNSHRFQHFFRIISQRCHNSVRFVFSATRPAEFLDRHPDRHWWHGHDCTLQTGVSQGPWSSRWCWQTH